MRSTKPSSRPASSVAFEVQAAGERSTYCMKRLTGVGSTYRLVMSRPFARMKVIALDSGRSESSLLPTVAVM